MTRSLIAGAMLLLTTAAFAAPSAIGDCEKIADPDAYNRCLAAFGPAAKAGARAVQEEPANADVPKVSRGTRGGSRYAKRGGRGGKSLGRGGRVRMEISVGGGGKARGRGRRR